MRRVFLVHEGNIIALYFTLVNCKWKGDLEQRQNESLSCALALRFRGSFIQGNLWGFLGNQQVRSIYGKMRHTVELTPYWQG